MSYLEEYSVNSKSKVPASNPTQVILGVSPKSGTPTHTPVDTITLMKGIPSGGSNRCGLEDPKDIAAVIYLSNTDFTNACNKAMTFVNYLSTDVVGHPIENLTNFNF